MFGRNAYTCQTCGQTVITEDMEKGVTPFMLACRATKGCSGMSQSHFYRGPTVESDKPATFIWRKPTKAERRAASPGMRQHFDQGGLNIYPAVVTAREL
jgi:hypothetical protein